MFLTNFVEHVKARNVRPVSLNNINELICRRVASERNVRARGAVFLANSLDSIVIQVRQPARFADAHTALLLPCERNICGFLVQPVAVSSIHRHTQRQCPSWLVVNVSPASGTRH